MEIKQVLISELNPADYNPRKLSPEQEASLKESLAKFGFVDPVIVNEHPDRKNVIIGGHQRVKAWKALGNIEVPVFYVALDKDQERELNVRLNKNTGEFDWNLLQEFFEKDELMAWGFTEDDLFGRFKTKTTGDDDAPGLPETPKSKRGDVYHLGPHVLMCGDSTSKEDVQTLMAGTQADMIFTDPPYNVNYKGRGKDTSRTIENDNMSQDAFRTFLLAAFQRANEATKASAPIYCCYASSTHREFEDGLNAAGYQVKNQIIWVKTVASMGWGDYRWKHEPMFYAKKSGAPTEFFAGRKEWTVWDHEPTDQDKIEIVNKMIKMEEDGNSTVWRFSRETSYVHPTQKPVALVSRALLNSARTHGTVLDLFGGSGSTLIAAEKNDRKARLMEFDPSFADVIVKRYVDFCIKNGRNWCVLHNNVDISSEFSQKPTGEQQGEPNA